MFKYPEEEDSTIWKRYIHEEKSSHMAAHGQPHPIDGPQQPNVESLSASSSDSQRPASTNRTLDHHTNAALNGGRGRRIDPEKGRDLYIVDWYGPDDPEASCTSGPRMILQTNNT